VNRYIYHCPYGWPSQSLWASECANISRLRQYSLKLFLRFPNRAHLTLQASSYLAASLQRGALTTPFILLFFRVNWHQPQSPQSSSTRYILPEKCECCFICYMACLCVMCVNAPPHNLREGLQNVEGMLWSIFHRQNVIIFLRAKYVPVATFSGFICGVRVNLGDGLNERASTYTMNWKPDGPLTHCQWQGSLLEAANTP
jgi:hypothetical protein